jgi:phosphohistidine phosphatase
MELYILRNGEAGSHAADIPEEFHRPLSEAGRQEAMGVAHWLARQQVHFDVIATSPLPRARETAEIVADAIDYDSQVLEWKALEPGVDTLSLLGHLTEFFKIQNVLLVGHEPELSRMISLLIAGHHHCGIHLQRAGLCKLRRVTFYDMPEGELHWLLSPDQMVVAAKEPEPRAIPVSP